VIDRALINRNAGLRRIVRLSAHNVWLHIPFPTGPTRSFRFLNLSRTKYSLVNGAKVSCFSHLQHFNAIRYPQILQRTWHSHSGRIVGYTETTITEDFSALRDGRSAEKRLTA